ncbi:MAG TPA: sulfite exporter TauE/SafE family protein [Acetobacteraceae bacterium]|nr:sulfite exporter TauE/SafE family protein [Acetobacteraceae bacterium]
MLLLFAAGLLGGAMNALAGGASFVTFPAMVFSGLPSVVANASNTVALVPGAITSTFATRRDLARVGDVPLPLMMVVSAAGGAVGALLLLLTPVAAFDALVPWLLLLATLTYVFGYRIGAALRRRVRIGRGALLAAQGVLSLYGGYFGGAVGIMMLATWSLLSDAELRRMTAARTILVGMANFAAVVCFVAADEVAWPQTLAMLVGATAGGYAGARVGLAMPVRVLRGVTIVIMITMTVVFFTRAYL